MFNWIKKLFGSVEEPEEAQEVPKKKVRARDSRGRWLPDDPTTEENEAYEEK